MSEPDFSGDPAPLISRISAHGRCQNCGARHPWVFIFLEKPEPPSPGYSSAPDVWRST